METPATNPYRPPPESAPERVVFCDPSQRPTEPPTDEYPLPGARTVAERLVFLPDRLFVDRGASKSSLLITREAFVSECDLVVGGFFFLIGVKSTERLGIPVPKEAAPALRRWLDPVIATVLARMLATRLRYGMPLGLLMLGASLPIFGWHVDPFAIAWATAMFLVSALSRFVKHRGLLLGDGFVWLLLLLWNGALLVQRWSFLTAALAIGAVVFASGSLRAFAFFGPPRALP